MPQDVIILHPDEGRRVGVLNDIVTFKLGTAETGGVFALLHGRVAPGGGIAMHQQMGSETFVILRGELEIQLLRAGVVQTVIVPAGSVVHLPAGVDHGYRNATHEPVEFFFLLAPAGKSEQFFDRIGVPLSDAGATPPFALQLEGADLLATFAEFGLRPTILPHE